MRLKINVTVFVDRYSDEWEGAALINKEAGMEAGKEEGMKEVKLFGKNVMLRQEKKSVVQLHLPAGAEEGNRELFDIVVVGIGDDVTRVSVGDCVIARIPPSCGLMNPADGTLVAIIQEDMIQGVVSEVVDSRKEDDKDLG